MALSTVMANSQASPVGVRMVGPKLEAATKAGIADCDFKFFLPMISAVMGSTMLDRCSSRTNAACRWN